MSRPFLLSSLVSVLVLLFAVTATGEEGIRIPVRLADATAVALKSRPEMRMELEKEEITRSKLRESRGSFLPTLDLTGSSYYVENYDTFTGINISAEIAGQNVLVNIQKEVPSYELSGELAFCYNLYAGGRDNALLHEAVNNLESATHHEEATSRKIRLEVARAYWGVKKAQAQYAMARRGLELAVLEQIAAETRHHLKRMSDEEYNAVVLKSREKEVGVKTAARDYLKAFKTYLHVLGLSEEIEICSSQQVPTLLDDPDTEERPAEDAHDHQVHPEVLRLSSDIQAASERRKAAESEDYPKFDLFAKYALVGRDSDSYLDSWRDARSEHFMVGVKVTMNVFNGLRTMERVRQADGEMRVKRLQLIETRRALMEEERARKTVLETAKDQLSLALERKRLEEAREIAARARLQSGKISEIEYRQKVADAENASDQVVIAKIDVVLARNALNLIVLDQDL